MKPVAIITGVVNGIGRHFTETVRHEYCIVGADLSREAVEGRFGAESDDFLPIALDVRDPEAWQAVIEACLRKFGRVDYLFNIAGVLYPGFITDMDARHIDLHLDTNVRGLMYGTYQVARVMEQQGGGHIINIASLAGIAPVPGMSAYVASKFAARGFSLAAALELRPKGIYVTTVCPDVVRTAMYDNQLAKPEESVIAFSGGGQVLSTADVVRLLQRAVRDKPMEMLIPWGRSWLAKLSNAMPWLGFSMAAYFSARGRKRLSRLLGRPIVPR